MSAIVCCCVSSDWGGGSDAWQVFVRESLSLQECDDTRKMPKHADILPQSESMTIVNTSSYTVVPAQQAWTPGMVTLLSSCPLSRNERKTFMVRIVISCSATLA